MVKKKLVGQKKDSEKKDIYSGEKNRYWKKYSQWGKNRESGKNIDSGKNRDSGIKIQRQSKKY